tara:strand:+ start:588 stop:782 length:195 start_codon:yes stop_codon:yes gene_type:complete
MYVVKIVRGDSFTAKMFTSHQAASVHYFAMTDLYGLKIKQGDVTVQLPDKVELGQTGGVLSMSN